MNDDPRWCPWLGHRWSQWEASQDWKTVLLIDGKEMDAIMVRQRRHCQRCLLEQLHTVLGSTG